MNTQKIMRYAAIGSILTVAAVSIVVSANDADGVEQYSTVDDVYKGAGWAAFTDYGVYSIDVNQTYVITYGSTTARTKLQPMVEKIATQLRGLGFKVFNTTAVETIPATGCLPKNHIAIGIKYRPTGKSGASQGLPCYNTNDHSLFSGRVWVNSEYKQLGGTWVISDKLWKNLFPHEFGHAFGLAHAPAGVKNAAGDTPAMTAPNGGFNTASKYGTFTSWDLAGLAQLKENYDA